MNRDSETVVESHPKPIPESYWVISGRFLAAEYPRDHSDQESLSKMRRIVGAGVTLFVDLTHSDDHMKPYGHLLDHPHVHNGVRARRTSVPVRDMRVPRPASDAVRILDAIDEELERGGVVYLHCWGGIGRTATIVGCWLVRHGREADNALEHLLTLWSDNPKSRKEPVVPQTPAQFRFVRNWHTHDPALADV